MLDVSRQASAKEIKSAFRKLSLKIHPDVSEAPDAAERFAEAKEAYDVLSSDDRRRQYDAAGGRRAARGGGSSQEDVFAYPDGPAEHVFVHEVRATSLDVAEALRVAPEYFCRSDRAVRYSSPGPVPPEDQARVHGLVGRSYSGCFAWVTAGQAEALLGAVDGAADEASLCDYLDSMLALAAFENGRWRPE